MSITIDSYRYEEIYPSFKAATDEKEKTARINAAFLNNLAAAGVVLTGNDPVMIADIGCGPCDTLVKYLTGVKFASGFKVRATDYSAEYADERSGEALATLAAANAAGTVKLADFSARAGDSFAGHRLELLGSRNSPARARGFRIVFASHVLYHCEHPGSAERLIDDVTHNVLADDGICILYHLAKVLSFCQWMPTARRLTRSVMLDVTAEQARRGAAPSPTRSRCLRKRIASIAPRRPLPEGEGVQTEAGAAPITLTRAGRC